MNDQAPGRRSEWFWAGGLALLIAVVFGHTVGFGFVNYDDFLTAQNALLGDWWSWSWYDRLATPHIGYPVPLPTAIWAAMWAAGDGPWPALAHGLNVLLHLANFVLLAAVLRRFCSSRGRHVAWLLAGLWALHPVNVEPVVWATGLKDVLAGTGFVACVLGLARWFDGRAGGRSLTLAGVGVAFASKPTGVALAPLVIGWLVLRQWLVPDDERPRRGAWLAGGGLVAFTVAYILFTQAMHAEFGGHRSTMPVVDRVVSALALQANHVVVPLGMRVMYVFEAPTVEGWATALGVTAALIMGIAFAVKKRSLAGLLGLGWLVLAYLPYSGLAGQSRFAADSYMYVPLMGLALAVLPIVAPLWDRLAVRIGLTGVALLFALLSFAESTDWRDGGQTLWAEVAAHHPDNAFVAMKHGQSLFLAREYEPARNAFESVDPRWFGTTIPFPPSWPQSYCEMGEIARCEELYVYGIQVMRANHDQTTQTESEYQNLLRAYEHFRMTHDKPVDPRLGDL